MLGLYAVVAYHVSTRSREIGIRLALGAPSGGLFRGVVTQGLVMGGLGGALGLAGWYALLPVVGTWVDAFRGGGAALPAVVAAVIGAACVLATVAPARRSTTVDPVVTLRAE